MPERLHPGVYVEEVPSTVRAIEGVSTSTAAFVGVAERGPIGKPFLVTSFKEYQDKFGGFIKDSFLTYSVLNFFENGGRKCYIVRVVGKNADSASIDLRGRERVAEGTAIYDNTEAIAEQVLRISAASKGVWGNEIDIEIKDSTIDPFNEFKIIVKRREDILEVWDNLSMVIGDDNYVADVLGSGQSAYIDVKRIASATTGALQRGTSKSKNEPSTVIDKKRTLSFNLNRDGFQSIQLDSGLNDGDKIAEKIQIKISAKQSERKDPVNEEAYKEFTAKYSSYYELVFGPVNEDAGTFTFVEPGSGTDLTGETMLHLRTTSDTPTKGETKYGESTASPLHVNKKMSESERTITSGSTEGFRPKSDLNKITDGTIGLTVRLPAASSDIPLTITLPANLSSGKKIAEAIQEAVRKKEADIDNAPDSDVLSKLKAATETRLALRFFEARYIANYTLKSGSALNTDDLGPISSVEILVSPIESDDVAIDLGLGISNGGVEQSGAAMLRPVNGEYHLGDNTVGGAVYQVTLGSNGDTPTDDDFIGDIGLKVLDKVDDINIIAIPGRGSKKVVSAGLGYAMNRKLQDCFFIGDMGGPHDSDPIPDKDKDNPFINTRDDAIKFARTLPMKSDFGAIYIPWIKAPDPIGKGKNPIRHLPPSGYMAGIYSRIDGKRGVFKAPAGTEANLIGTSLPALDLAVKIDDTDQDFLNPIGVNVIRSFPASGIVAWGARTIGSDSAWRYISVRRMAIFLRVSIYNGIQWAVFEPNDEPLWSSLRLNIGSFMYNQFRAGAFQGSTPSEAYFVRCDSSTTTQQDIDNGVVNVLVGFAPLKPAEFVVIKLSQKAGQTPK